MEEKSEYHSGKDDNDLNYSEVTSAGRRGRASDSRPGAFPVSERTSGKRPSWGSCSSAPLRLDPAPEPAEDEEEQGYAIGVSIEGELTKLSGYPDPFRWRPSIVCGWVLLLGVVALGVGLRFGLPQDEGGGEPAVESECHLDLESVYESGVQPDIFQQCECLQSISYLHPLVLSRYEEIRQDFIKTLLGDFNEPRESCSPRNQALVWLAIDNEEELDGVYLRDRYLLVLLYAALNGVSWSVSSGWLSSDSICDWAGVLCIDDIFAGQTVRSLSLINIGLSGTLPTEIALFPSLRNLDLSSNTLMGPIPSQIGSLNELATLNLQQNRFSGSIPTALSSLSTLEVLEIGFNLLTNNIPTELGQLSSLTRLSLEQNSHLGTIPTELGRLQNLLELVLNDCSLLGKIPTSIGAMTSLEKLWLEANFLTDIPTEIGNLSQLRLVSISRNEGLGELPSEIGNLSNLGEYI